MLRAVRASTLCPSCHTVFTNELDAPRRGADALLEAQARSGRQEVFRNNRESVLVTLAFPPPTPSHGLEHLSLHEQYEWRGSIEDATRWERFPISITTTEDFEKSYCFWFALVLCKGRPRARNTHSPDILLGTCICTRGLGGGRQPRVVSCISRSWSAGDATWLRHKLHRL